MKKIFSLILSLSLFFSMGFSLMGCKPTQPTPTPPSVTEPELDLDSVFFDDFNSVDPNVWGIMNTRWGGKHHGGVLRENVGYTDDGVLVLTANGDFYNGDVKDVDGKVGKRTGAAITSHQSFGPGVFSARMKAMPRFGATTAFWTFFNDGKTLNDRGQIYNSEIDFEFNVDTFNTTMCTNWTAEKTGNYDNQKIIGDVYHNDGEWHEYTFKWMTNPKYIEYYVDGKLVTTSKNNVPTYGAPINLGIWFAQFAGTSDFETDYMQVDWIKITPYLDQPYNETPSGSPPSTSVGYPTAPMTLPNKVNLAGDAHFEYDYSETENSNAWYMYPGDKDEKRTLKDAKVLGDGIDGSVGLTLLSFDRVIQTFSHVFPGYKIDFSALIKHSATGSGKLVVQYMPGTDEILATEEIIMDANNPNYIANDFYKISKQIVIPKLANGQEVSRMRIRFIADEKENNAITIDNVELYHVK